MKDVKSVAIVGLGAVGSVVAIPIHETMPDRLTVIATGERAERLRRDGLIFNDKRYDFVIGNNPKPQDLIIIATKAGALGEAIDQIEPWVGPDTIILPLLNGITSEERLAARYGWSRVLLAYYLGHTTSRHSNSVSHDGLYNIYFGVGPRHTSQDELKVGAVVRLFDTAGVHYRLPEDMLSSLWQKYIINIGTNQSTAIHRMPYGSMRDDPAVMALTVELMEEAAAVAAAIGIAGADSMVRRAIKVIGTMNPDDKSSMLQDVEAGRTTEIELFAETLSRLASKFSIATPRNDEILEFFAGK